MEPTKTIPSYSQMSLRPKWFIPLSIAALVILVSALASGITFALVSNSNNTKASTNTASVITTIPTTLTQTTVVPSTITPTTSTTTVPATDPYAGWKDYSDVNYDITFKYPSSLKFSQIFHDVYGCSTVSGNIKDISKCPIKLTSYLLLIRYQKKALL